MSDVTKELIPDLENIVSQYLDIHDYSKLISLKPNRYSWLKYFPVLPDIYDAIEEYDNLDLVKYLDSLRTSEIQYLDVNFQSIEVAKFIMDEYPPKHHHYVYILQS